MKKTEEFKWKRTMNQKIFFSKLGYTVGIT